MDLKENYFQLFDLACQFDIDIDDLASRYRRLQASVHPDRFTGRSDQERRISLQYATFVNEAHNVLKEPIKRACYLLELNGISYEENGEVEPAFLLEQIELRERLEEIEGLDDPLAALDAFLMELNQVFDSLGLEFASSLRDDNLPEAEQAVYKMQFLNKLKRSASSLEEKILG